jgi:vacuolar-type H+-ATPase subunit I/STV1
MEIYEDLERTRAALLDTLAGLDEAALDRKGVVGEWSIKNALAHIAAWEAWVVQALPTRLTTGKTPEDFLARIQDEDRFNAEEVAEREELTPSEQLIELERTRQALLDELRALEAAAWERRAPWDTWEGTLAEYLRESLIVHEQEHLVEFRAGEQRKA